MKYFETVIRVPMPEGSLAWGKVAAKIEPLFETLAKGLAQAKIEGVDIKQRETTVKGPREKKIDPDAQMPGPVVLIPTPAITPGLSGHAVHDEAYDRAHEREDAA